MLGGGLADCEVVGGGEEYDWNEVAALVGGGVYDWTEDTELGGVTMGLKTNVCQTRSWLHQPYEEWVASRRATHNAICPRITTPRGINNDRCP